VAICRTCSDRSHPAAQADSGDRPARSAVLLLRVWSEGDDLRCRLLQGAPADGVVAVAQGVDAICDAVRRWLLAIDRP
jgi:hypothetical protein